MNMIQKESASPFERTRTQYLIRYKPSGVYFAKFKAGGRQFRFSLKTTVLTVARIRLAEKLKEHRGSGRKCAMGRMTVGQIADIYRQQFETNPRLKDSTKGYYTETLDYLLKTWKGLPDLDVSKITEADCRAWAAGAPSKLSGPRFNATLAKLRHLFDVAVKQGARHSNPAKEVQTKRVQPKRLTLPSTTQFRALLEEMGKAKSRDSQNCLDFVRFLAYTGCRKGEAAKVTWADLDFTRGVINVRGDLLTGTKNWETRRVPMIPAARALLLEMRERRSEEPETGTMLLVRECQKSLDRAAKIVGMARITHHDLRHLFATICIESGVDIPTVSRWLGHKDGGTLAMKTYGHLRDEHSASQAERVAF